jgi:polar amino acid transport system substrate-binding protein
VTALKNKQIDGIVVDLPCAFYLTGVEIEGGKIIGQLASNGTVSDQFGLLLAKGSPLTKCVTQAVDTLRSNGSLAAIEDQWLTQFGNAPVLN